MSMEHSYILAIDQGTTGSTALILKVSHNKKLSLVAKANCEFKQHFPQSSWVEHDLEEIWGSIEKSCLLAQDLAEKKDPHFNKNRIITCGITNQRETLCFWDRKTAQAARKAIVWQCKEALFYVKSLKQKDSSQL